MGPVRAFNGQCKWNGFTGVIGERANGSASVTTAAVMDRLPSLHSSSTTATVAIQKFQATRRYFSERHNVRMKILNQNN